MAAFSNNLFVGQKILLDGNTFKSNHFQNCVLVYGGGPLSMVDNVLDGVQWEFVDAAARTVGLIASFYQAGSESQKFVELLLSTFNKQPAPPMPPAPTGLTP